MDMKVYTGEISPHLKPNTKVSLSFFFFPLNTLIITLLMWSQRKSTYCTSLHPEMIVSPLPVRISCLWPCYSRDRQPPAGFLPWSTAGQAALIPLHTPPISVPPTIPGGTDSPERNRKEGEVREKLPSLTRCWRKAMTVLFSLTQERNKIMSVIIPVAGEGLDPGQSGHAHLLGMHQPIREESKWATIRNDFAFCGVSEHTTSPL